MKKLLLLLAIIYGFHAHACKKKGDRQKEKTQRVTERQLVKRIAIIGEEISANPNSQHTLLFVNDSSISGIINRNGTRIFYNYADTGLPPKVVKKQAEATTSNGINIVRTKPDTNEHGVLKLREEDVVNATDGRNTILSKNIHILFYKSQPLASLDTNLDAMDDKTVVWEIQQNPDGTFTIPKLEVGTFYFNAAYKISNKVFYLKTIAGSVIITPKADKKP
jgi:hypothetical protein